MANLNNHEDEEHVHDSGSDDEYDLPEVTLQLHPSHPLYLHPNENSGMSIVNLVLTESNYSEWSRAMTIAMSTRMKFGLLSGTHARPKSNSKYLLHWDRCNNMLISWILNSVTPDIRSSIVYMNTAKSMWEELQARYTQGNAPQLYQIKKEISSFTQGSMSVNTYYTRFKALWDEFTQLLNAPKCVCHCTCGAIKLLEEADHLQKLTQFLMGLNEQYASIRSSILAMNPIPSLAKAVPLICQDENSRGVGVHSILPMAVDSTTALYAKTNAKTYSKKPHMKSNLVCDHCGGLGHTKEGCFFIKGFPEWHKLYGVKPDPTKMPKYLKPKSASQLAPSTAPPLLDTPTNVNAVSASSASVLTPDQYQNLLQVVHQQPPFQFASEMTGPCAQESEGDW